MAVFEACRCKMAANQEQDSWSMYVFRCIQQLFKGLGKPNTLSWRASLFLKGDRLGQLWTDGSQMFHGRGSYSTGGAWPQHHGDWLVQALPDLLHGGPKDGAADPPLLPDVLGEHHWAVLRAIVRPDRRRQSASCCAPFCRPRSGWRCRSWSRLGASPALLLAVRRY